MDVGEAMASFSFLSVRLRMAPQESLKLPALNKGNTLRGAFGGAFRRLVCIPQCRDAHRCPLDGTCPYQVIFEPGPPPGSDRLSKNQDIPRPFVFRPPLDAATTYAPGEAFDFTLTLLGKAVDFLPYFILAFREVAREGIGLNRARCELEEARAVNPEFGVPCPEPRVPCPVSSLIYTSADQLFRTPQAYTLADYVQARLEHLFSVPGNLSPVTSPLAISHYSLTTTFLTPTFLKSDGHAVRQPEFHQLFKRVRDRLNALCTFYGPGPIDADFKGLGQAAERVRTVRCDLHWQERSRRSSKTGQRHELSGFTGSCTYEFPVSGFDVPVSNLELLKWIMCGEFLHAGRHTAWGNGWYSVLADAGVTNGK